MDANPAQVPTVSPETPIHEVIATLQKHDTGSMTVCKDGRVVGMFIERDALRLMATNGDLNAPVETAMASPAVTVWSTDKLDTAIARMHAGGFRRLPIVDKEGQLVGMLKVSGILHYLVQHFPEAVYNLPPAPQAVPQEREGP